MSRIGVKPVIKPEGVDVSLSGQSITVKGAKGELTLEIPGLLEVVEKDGTIIVSRKSDDKHSKSVHGTYRVLISNAVKGVKDGYEKRLELVGVGYRAKLDGANLSMTLGWNHPIVLTPPEGITVEVPEETKIIITGVDKQLVGEFAGKIREQRKPEPYKGKGVRYENEHVRRKSAKVVVAE